MATDLYGLGGTLICLLMGIKSTAIETLIDEDSRIVFQHLVPQLSLTFIDWLERMVQPHKKDRFPSAAKALAALQPLLLSSIPEVQLSQSILGFNATKLGKKLTQSLPIKNSLPDTVQEGIWEVAPHPNDPPHTPNYHAWIAFQPARFVRNQADCKIIVDTSNLMLAKTYERKIFLHSNSVPETNYAFIIKVQTASFPRDINKSLWRMTWKDLKTEFGTILAGLLFLLTAALGVSFASGLVVGFLNPFIIFIILATGLSLVWIINYKKKERSRLVAEYQKSEQSLIKP